MANSEDRISSVEAQVVINTKWPSNNVLNNSFDKLPCLNYDLAAFGTSKNFYRLTNFGEHDACFFVFVCLFVCFVRRVCLFIDESM